MWKVMGSSMCELDPNVKLKYFFFSLLNASPPKQLDVVASNFACA